MRNVMPRHFSRRERILAWVLPCLALLLFCNCSAKVEDTRVLCRVEIDKEVLTAGEIQKAVIKVTLDGVEPPAETERSPVNLAIVLDRSGSMSGQKIEKAKDAAIEALRRLGADDLFSMVIYDHTIQTIVPAQSAANTERIEGRIRQISSGGNTALFGGVSQGAAEIRKNLQDKYVHRILLLSDGLANVGPSSPEDLGRLGASLMKEGVSVSTMGVGNDYNEDLMTRLSQESDGNSYFVEASQDLPRIFAAELGDVLSVVAKKVRIDIECPAGVRPVRIIGRDGRINGQKVEIQLNQLYGGQEKYALLEVEVAETNHGVKRDLAVANVYYEDAVSLKQLRSTDKVSVLFSEDKEMVAKSINLDVEEIHQVNITILNQEEAVKLADEGQLDKAQKLLLDNDIILGEMETKLKQGGKDTQQIRDRQDFNAGWQMDLDEVAKGQATEEEKKKLRKKMKTNSYQWQNQQKSK